MDTVLNIHKTPGELAGEFTPDFERAARCGFPEVIFATGKTDEQVVSIAAVLLQEHGYVLATHASASCAELFCTAFEDAIYLTRSKLLFVDRREDGIMAGVDLSSCSGESALIAALLEGGAGNTVVCCAGTSDLPVAEEAAVTARIMGSAVTLVTDIGIAGVHRVLGRQAIFDAAHAIAVAAGMEGALPSLVAGLVDVPVIAIPTSVGYGASFGGVAALLGMLNSCAGGVSVVNIDNGFGAGQILDRINRPPARFAK